MTERISRLRSYIVNHEHHSFREAPETDPAPYRSGGLAARTAKRLELMLAAQKTVFLPDERFIATRTTADFPDILSDEEREEIFGSHYIHERGYVCNICPDYSRVLREGLGAELERLEQMSGNGSSERENIEARIASIKALLNFAKRYRAEAERTGREELAALLERIPYHGAQTLHEAMQLFRLLHFAIWCEGEYHVIIGRLDQLLYPYYRADIEAGRLDRSSALELVEDFFLSFNKDSDLYPGMQQGDNGQSVVLGGYDADGNDMYNELSELMLTASLELRVIDPKINLRVSAKTPPERFELASKLTAVGIGFPQYANDDVVVPGLKRLGYAPEDAQNYVVAACWEFIIPGCGADIPNIGALPMLETADTVMREYFSEGMHGSFEDFKAALRKSIFARTEKLAAEHKNLFMRPAPFMSLFFEGCRESARDISHGSRYNNYGLHGTGLANAADVMTAVERMLFGGELEPKALIEALDRNFEGAAELKNRLSSLPKVGNNDREADKNLVFLLDSFASAVEGLVNERGGCYRSGTGSAMYYVSHAAGLGATADGRGAGEFLPANYSPSLGIKLSGPMSVISSFTKPELSRSVNGGPLTLELAASSVADSDGIRKVGMLVRSFILRGGHQIQLNVVNREHLLDAQAHPEKYRNLIVRVWGWSGYFVELDRVYQEHIIKRTELNA